MVELVSSSGVLNTVKKQHKIVKEPVSCLKTLTIIGYQNQVDDCLSFISERKPNSLWFEAIDMGNQYETEDGNWVFQLHLGPMLQITFEEVKSLSRLFCDLLFVADGLDMSGGF